MAFYAEDVVWYPCQDLRKRQRLRRGRDGVRDLMRDFADGFDEYTVTAGEIREHGD